MDKKLRDVSIEELKKLPGITNRNWLGEEWIHLHVWNPKKKLNWYLAEFDPEKRFFYGFAENRSDGISSGNYTLEELLDYGKRGSDWELLIDENWKPVYSKEIPYVKEYIKMMIAMPDIV
ncbi:MAG TPA: hypothetical protein VN455_03970 [Methanotrichaceae archaeon]|nr:hypothetical protein [Methanotrichaceae archaeon]